MRATHKNTVLHNADDIGSDWKSSAKALEQEGENEKAIRIYEAVLKQQPHNAYIYDRLMILYRKEKMYKKELSLIKTAIHTFETLFRPVKEIHTKKITSLSKSILRSVGLTDKKGAALYQPQPVFRWQKRKDALMKKI